MRVFTKSQGAKSSLFIYLFYPQNFRNNDFPKLGFLCSPNSREISSKEPDYGFSAPPPRSPAMDSLDRGGDDSTFRFNFDGDGLSRIRNKVEEKLKEFLGDYTDDILVEYVLMLLRNGRSRDQSQKDLNAFLGDDSVSFVSWLWDHISSNMHLYSQQKESRPNEVVKSLKTTHILDEHSGGQKSQIEHVHGNVQTASENEREQSKFSRSRRNKEWKGLAREGDPFPLRSTVSKILHPEEETHTRSNVKQSPPRSEVQVQRKRSPEEERYPMKRNAASRQVVGAACRLLQFAVRDAVRNVQQSSSRSGPELKRLHSVVSTSTADSLMDGRPKRIRSVARVPGPVSAALKAAAEAAEDVSKTRCSGSVFDRLSHGRGTYVAEPIKLSPNLEEPMLEDGEYEDDQIPELSRQDYQGREYDGEFYGDLTVFDRDTGISADYASDNDGYDGVGTAGQQSLSVCQRSSSANRDSNTLTAQYRVAQDANEAARDTRFAKQDPPASATTNPSSKIVNISVNVNTWKPPHYQAPKDAIEADTRVTVEKTEMNAEQTIIQPPKVNNATMTVNGSETARGIVQKESQKTLASTPGSYAIGRPYEDVDSRTVFVSNVNFAATKDTLSRHFNQFGEVLKVIIVNDAATGQPKGFAYVEFMRKESAESALSLNGTSFMSRVVKVVRKSSVHHAAAPMLGWPQIARASQYASRLRLPSSRGVLSGSFRARLPLKSGARSLQWKRGSSTAPTTAEGVMSNNQNTSPAAANNLPFPRGRNLTYVRQESKVDGSSGPA